MKQQRKVPLVSMVLLGMVILCSMLADVFAPYTQGVMDSGAINSPPNNVHLFGTDTMGRDVLSMLLYGGRASLLIGLLSGGISLLIGVIYGTAAGLSGRRMDDLLMRFAELLLSIPSILLILFLQAIWGQATWLSLAVVIGVIGWVQIAKTVRSEVRQIGRRDYVLAAKIMDAHFPYLLRRHLLPNFFSSILFMAVTNIGQAMLTESTLSFLGLGLPLTTVSWGSLLSLSQDALLTGSWWTILLPGLVLLMTLTSIAQIGEYLRGENTRRYSNL